MAGNGHFKRTGFFPFLLGVDFYPDDTILGLFRPDIGRGDSPLCPSWPLIFADFGRGAKETSEGKEQERASTFTRVRRSPHSRRSSALTLSKRDCKQPFEKAPPAQTEFPRP
jgi:hypothetical protein